MRIKGMGIALLTATLTITTIVGTTLTMQDVYADTSQQTNITKSATLNNLNISINGGKSQIVQAYNIDGYNYFRVRDICKPLDMNVQAIPNETGVVITPQNQYSSSGEMPKLTEKTLKVQIGTTRIGYSPLGWNSNASYFNYGGHNFFKLQDIVTASKTDLDSLMKQAKDYGSDKNYSSKFPYDAVTSLTVSYDGSTNTISLKKVSTNLQEIFNSAKGENPASSQIPKMPIETSPPIVGSCPAKILIDQTKGAYIDGDSTKGVLVNNITPPYMNGVFGQCSWYASDRLMEVSGKNLNPTLNSTDPNIKQYQVFGTPTGDWVINETKANGDVLGAITDINEIQNNVIACWKTHVVFVEYVEKGSDGTPTNIYYTEANNWDGTHKEGVYYPNFDGVVKEVSWNDFKILEGSNNPLLGYVYVK